MTELTYPCFIARPDGRGRWYWTYFAQEGRPIAHSKEVFFDRRGCEESIERIQDSSTQPVFFFGL